MIEYLVRFVMRMKPINREQRISLLSRFGGALCQQGVRIRGTLRPKGVPSMRSGTAAFLGHFMNELYITLQRQAAYCPSCDKRAVSVPKSRTP